MNALVKIVDGDARTSSRMVAAVFEKQHKDVLRAIDQIVEQRPELRQRNFAPSEDVVQAGFSERAARIYEMDRDGFTLVAMGFTGEKALDWKLKYIEAFNAMEALIAENDDEDDPDCCPVLPPLDEPLDIERLRVKLNLIRECRYVYGPKAARTMWVECGLPEVHKPQEPLSIGYAPAELDERLKGWLEERCALDPSARTEASALYRDYRAWCRTRGRVPWRQKSFGVQLGRIGVRAHKSGRVWRLGIRLKG